MKPVDYAQKAEYALNSLICELDIAADHAPVESENRFRVLADKCRELQGEMKFAKELTARFQEPTSP